MEQLLDEKNVIAQDDDRDYQESGYVVCVKDGLAAIGSYEHCSCFGTWDEQGYPKEVWSGTVAELIALAAGDFDPAVSGRKLSDQDYDVDHLRACYQQVMAWARTSAVMLKENP